MSSSRRMCLVERKRIRFRERFGKIGTSDKQHFLDIPRIKRSPVYYEVFYIFVFYVIDMAVNFVYKLIRSVRNIHYRGR